ncbi:MAG: DUF4124 domain-containing protein [Burkholderiaceae bacterium]
MVRSQSIQGGFGLTALLLALLWSVPAAGQWAWKEDNGRQVYSDRPPPSSVKPSQITQQPSRQVVAPTPSRMTADDEAKPAVEGKSAPAPAAPKTVAEREMEFNKRQKERTDSENKAQEEQQRSSMKAAECERARGYQKTLDDGIRIQKTDASGNREYLDDNQRAAEVERTRKFIQTNCS